MLIGTGVGRGFFAKLASVALIAGFVASPAVFLEIWKFVAPGLYAAERRLAKPFVFLPAALWPVATSAGR